MAAPHDLTAEGQRRYELASVGSSELKVNRVREIRRQCLPTIAHWWRGRKRVEDGCVRSDTQR